MDKLAEIKVEMAAMGWKGPADTGFTHKVNESGTPIALKTCDAWMDDFELAVKRVARRAQAVEVRAEPVSSEEFREGESHRELIRDYEDNGYVLA